MSESDISAVDDRPRQTVAVRDSEMAYVEVGEGAPIVLLHGNPTSSYLWRNIVPQLEGLGRCLVPDLIGMGESGKSGDGAYRFADHACYLDAWFDAVGVAGDAVIVGHDWGGALGMHWANRHRDRVRGIAYMETFVAPVTWDDWPDAARGVFQAMRSEAGEELVLEKNVFVERILPGSVLRDLTDAEMTVYRRPFAQAGEDRRPTLAWPREIPMEGEPADVVALVEDYATWLNGCDLPKLFVNAEPGAILVGRQRELCRGWPNQTEVTVAGNHFLQEDSPRAIGQAIAAFVRGLDGAS
jgi:haloalkane dehalogenase